MTRIPRAVDPGGWAWVVSAVAATGVALVLAFVLTFMGNRQCRSAVGERTLCVAVLGQRGRRRAADAGHRLCRLRLYVRLRRGKFGSRLLIKLAGIFALVGAAARADHLHRVVTSSSARSIEAWFDVRHGRRAGRWPGAGQGHAGRAGGSTLVGKTRVAAERMADAGSAGLTLADTGTHCANRFGAIEAVPVVMAQRGRCVLTAGRRQRRCAGAARAPQRGAAAPGQAAWAAASADRGPGR
jgi:hypothetical protein